eukprot:3506817-Pleurochrysis_carterae.AAC.1
MLNIAILSIVMLRPPSEFNQPKPELERLLCNIRMDKTGNNSIMRMHGAMTRIVDVHPQKYVLTTASANALSKLAP